MDSIQHNSFWGFGHRALHDSGKKGKLKTCFILIIQQWLSALIVSQTVDVQSAQNDKVLFL